MLRPGGYAIWADPVSPSRPVERDTVTCAHCDRIIFTKPGSVSTTYLIPDLAGGPDREVPGAGCFVCMRPVCLRCHARGTCTPLEKRLAAMEGRTR